MLTLRPGQRILNIPSIGVQASRRAVSAGAAADWWAVAGKTCAGAYAALNAASYAASKINLANPGTVDLTEPTGALTWNAGTGWSSDGSKYLECGVSAGISWTHIVRFANCNSGNFYPIVNGSESWKAIQIIPRAGLNLHTYMNGLNSGYDGAWYISAGVMAIAGNSAYLDGVFEGTMTQVASTFTPINVGGAIADTLHYAVYSDTLTADEVATVSAAMAAL